MDSGGGHFLLGVFFGKSGAAKFGGGDGAPYIEVEDLYAVGCGPELAEGLSAHMSAGMLLEVR